MRKGFILPVIALSTSAGTITSCSNMPSKPPNIVFFLIDDLGWTDLGCYGSTFYETPNIDELASRSTVFTNAYSASAVCSPTRAAILTGKYPARLKITNWIGPEIWHVSGKMKTPEFRQQLPLEEFTLAEALKQHGYSTCFIGKWHLGKSDYYPDKQGFDINIAGNDAGGPTSYFSPYINDGYNKVGWDGTLPNLEPGPPGEYLTDRLTDEAINFLDTVAGKKPFLLYLSHYAVHEPIRAREEIIEKYRKKAAELPETDIPEFLTDINNSYSRQIQIHPVYAAMVESVDESIGRIMDRIQELGIADNTIIIFTSDNGGLSNSNFQRFNYNFHPLSLPTSVYPLRTGKGWYYEGGIRVPALIYWPKAVTNGLKSDEPITSTDFYPTILEMCGINFHPDQHKDGISLVPILTGQTKKLERESIYWHFPHYHSRGETPVSAIRKGDYKLIQRYEDNTIELYDLDKDISEQFDLADILPDVKDELLFDLKNWLISVDADMPLTPGYEGHAFKKK
jgi:arylsulfatase A-like enzyme